MLIQPFFDNFFSYFAKVISMQAVANIVFQMLTKSTLWMFLAIVIYLFIHYLKFSQYTTNPDICIDPPNDDFLIMFQSIIFCVCRFNSHAHRLTEMLLTAFTFTFSSSQTFGSFHRIFIMNFNYSFLIKPKFPNF